MLFEIMTPDLWGIYPAIIASEFSVPIYKWLLHILPIISVGYIFGTAVA
jgi:hypothetical protein